MRETIRLTTRDTMRGGLALALAVGLGACSDSPTGPTDGGLDTRAADASLTTFDGFFGSTEWRSFEAFGSRVEGSGVQASVIPSLDDLAPNARDGREAVARASRRLFAATSQTPLISSGSLGKTFVIDPATGEYVEDPERTGGPANGVRFVLYTPFDGTDDPDPDREIGHVDLVDNGATASGIDLRLTAVAGETTFLDYGVAIEGDEAAGSVDVDGFLLHEGRRLDFAFLAEGTESGGTRTLSVDASLDVDEQDFHVILDVDGTGDDSSESMALNLSVAFEAQSIAITASGSDQEISAVFRVNGEVFATAQGNPEQPVIVGADGEQLTLDEVRVLLEIITVSEEVLSFFGELLEPAGNIIQLGIIL